MQKLTVIVPVFNSQRFLADIFTEMESLRTVLAEQKVALQLICVDDGSADASFPILMRRFQEHGDLTVVKLTRNFGAISALKSTFDYIEGDAFLFVAADLQDPPSLIPRMVERWQQGHKYVIARRIARNDTASANFFAVIYYRFLRNYVVKNYPEHGFDLALMDRQFLPYLKQTGKHINIPLFPFWLGFEPSFIEYERRTIENKKSSWSFAKKFNLMIDSLLSFSRRPTRFLSIVGLVISLISFAYAFFIVVSALLGKITVPGFATIMALMSFSNGLIFLFLGITCEYLWRIFDEINGHPAAVVDQVLVQNAVAPVAVASKAQ